MGDGGVSIPPLVRSVGFWVRGGCTVFCAGFGRRYFIGDGVGKHTKIPRKRLMASRSWPQHTVAVAMHHLDCDRFVRRSPFFCVWWCSFNDAAYVFWLALTDCDRKFAAAMHHMVCDRLVCRRSRCLSSVVEMGVCFLELAGLDCSFYARV